MKYNYEKLEALMLHKKFEELNPKEQTWVKAFLSKQEYQLQRKILIEGQAFLTEKPSPPLANLKTLQAKFKTQHRKSAFAFLTQPIGIHYTLLLTTAVALLVYFWRPIEISESIVTKIVYQTKIDTLIQEKIIYKDKVIYQKEVIQLPPPAPDTVYMPIRNSNQFFQEKNETPVFAKSSMTGKSIKEMEALMNFVVGEN